MLGKYNYFNYLKFLKPSNLRNRLEYLRWKAFINDTEFSSREYLDILQLKSLQKLLNYSYNNISYYHKLFNNLGIHPNEIRSLRDFKRIPLLTKDQIRSDPGSFAVRNNDRKMLVMTTTGGSSGKPLGFYRNPIMDIIESAFMFHMWGRVGFRENSNRVILRGEPVKNNQLFHKHRFDNVWLMSSYHLSSKYIREYVSGLNKIRPEFFHVYPTSFYLFTQLLIEKGLKLESPVKAILCGSEPVFNYQRKLFEEFYKTRVFSWLGQAEGAVLAGECEHSAFYHVWPQHSFVELLDEQGNEVKEKGKAGEIVGTTLNNFHAPFIRYRTGDIGFYEDNYCHYCGRNYMILSKIEGRAQDKILLEDGRRIPLTAITFGLHFDAYKKINKMQVVQKEHSRINLIIDVAGGMNFDKSDEYEISSKMKNAVGGSLTIEFMYSKDQKKTQSGKHIYFIQEIKN